MAERLIPCGENMEIWRFHITEIREQDVNARTMSPEQFDRLSANMRKEKRMESLPFGKLEQAEDDSYLLRLISGHHRTRAARQAGLTEVYALVDTRELTRSQVVAKQLAHNAFQGEDDPAILRQLWSEVTDVDDLLEAYVDPEFFDMPDVGDMGNLGIPDYSFDWRTVSFVFIPRSFDRFMDLCERLERSQDLTCAVPLDQFEKFRDAASRLGVSENIRSTGALIARMVEITTNHLDALDEAEEAAE